VRDALKRWVPSAQLVSLAVEQNDASLTLRVRVRERAITTETTVSVGNFRVTREVHGGTLAPMTTWSTGVCETNGVSIHYIRTGGTRPPVLLLHGLTGSGACWTPLARALEGEFDVVMPDARGHGDSSAPEHGYRYDDLASDVVALIRSLGLSRPVLLGHSMGGMTAAVAASRGEGLLRGLILVDPTFLSPERQREVHESDVAEQHCRALSLRKSDLVAEARARHPSRSPEIVELQAEARLKTRLVAFDVLTPPNPTYRDVVRAIDVPSLLVIGDNNPVVTLEMATELRGLNPRVRIEQVRDTGHGLPFEQPARLSEVVASFLRELA
jgi:N-formylmaleamate deformylase